MKKIILASALLAATAFSASAEGSKVFNGFYLGAQAGFVKSKLNDKVTNEQLVSSTAGVSTSYSKSSNGFLFGTYFGYGHNINGFYIGGEMSILKDSAKRNVKGDATDSSGVNTYKTDTTFKRGIAFGFAPRLGYVFGENLVYVKPGFEVSRDKITSNKSSLTRGIVNVDLQWSERKTNVVFTPAFGYERAIGNVLVRAEYTYNAGKKYALTDTVGSINETAKISYKDHRFVIGAAYKF